MGAPIPLVDPAQVTYALVATLLDVFDAARDLHQTLRAKARRDYEHLVRSRSGWSRRSAEIIDDDDDFAGEDALVMDKAAVKRQYETGLEDVGPAFAIGDVFTQTAIQSQIITLQSVVITIFLYGPTSQDPISTQMADLVDASRKAGTVAVDVLKDQRARQSVRRFLPAPTKPVSSVHPSQPSKAMSSVHPRSSRPRSSTLDDGRSERTASRTAPPATIADTSTALVRSRHDERSTKPPYPAHTTILDGPQADPTDTGSTSTALSPCCSYALDLQQHPDQPLSASITSDPSPFCPDCKRSLHLQPGKSWEVTKDCHGRERQFRVQNRFVVKCHRDGADGGYCCVLCLQDPSIDVVTVCGDVRALIKHLWQDHSAAQLAADDDVIEVLDRHDRRRDSGVSAGSRRSVSLGPSKTRSRRVYSREMDPREIWSQHRGA